MARVQTLSAISSALLAISVMMLITIVVHFALLGWHTDGFKALTDEHLNDGEKDALLADDRQVSLVLSETDGDPIVIEGDIVFNEQITLQNNLTVVETVLRRLITRRLVTRTFEGDPGDILDVTEILRLIEQRINPTPNQLADFTGTLISEIERYSNIEDAVNATCTNYTNLILLEQIQQQNLTEQDIRITQLENSITNATVNGSIFDTYDIDVLLDVYNALFTNVTVLENNVDTLLMDAEMLLDSIQTFVNMTNNGTQVFGMIVNETLILVGQVGTLFNDTSQLLDNCTDSSIEATNLLTLVTSQLTLLNVTQLTIINTTLSQIQLDLTTIITILDQIELITELHTTLVDQLVVLNVTINDCKADITALLDETELYLDAANGTNTIIDGLISTTNTTLQTFITTVETFLDNSGISLLANVSAANTTLYAEYDTLISDYLVLENLVTGIEGNLTALWVRVNIAQTNVSILTPLILSLDTDISTLLTNVLALDPLVTTLLSDSTTLNSTSVVLLQDALNLNDSFTALQNNIVLLNGTIVSQQTTIDDHEVRITALETIAASLASGTVRYQHIIPELTAGETLAAGDVVSIDETGRVVLAAGLREVDEFVYAQQFNSTLVGDTLTVGPSDDIHPGAATAIDASDNMYLTVNYEGDAVSFENMTVINAIPSIITDNRDRIYSGVGDVLMAKYNYAQAFVWMVAIDSSMSTTIAGISVNPVTQDIWVVGSVLGTAGVMDFSLQPNSREVHFLNADQTIAYNYTIGVGPTDVLETVAIGFMGAVTQAGEWRDIHIFEADGYSGNGTDFAVLTDVVINRRGDVHACGFFNRDVTLESMTWWQANFTSGGRELVASLTRVRADLNVISRTAAPYLHAVGRSEGFYFTYQPLAEPTPSVKWLRRVEVTDNPIAPGVQQRPIRLCKLALDQADNLFVLGWYGHDIANVNNVSAAIGIQDPYRVTIEIDAGDPSVSTIELDRVDSDDMNIILGRIQTDDGDFQWITTDASNPDGSEAGVFSQNHRLNGVPATLNVTKDIYHFFDPSYQPSLLTNHRGDVIIFPRILCGGFNFLPMRWKYATADDETDIINMTCISSRHYLVKFEGSSGAFLDSAGDQGDEPFFIARAVIGPDSYIWLTYRTFGNANFEGSGLLSPSPGAQSTDYFYKLDPDFNVIWGEARSSEISFVQEISAVLVDRHRNFWYIEDVYSGSQTVNITRFPDFEPSSLSFRLVRNVDLTHIPIGITMDAGVVSDPVRVVMEGIVPNTTLPTLRGRNYCNFHGTLSTERCYSMPSMGFAATNGSLTVDIHRDALRFPTRSNSVY